MANTCPLCGAANQSLVSEKDRHGNPLRTILCDGCGIITNDPIPSDEELAAFYKKDYRTDYKGTVEPRMRQVWRNFVRMEQHMIANRDVYAAGMKCLDLGSGSGEFMFLAKAMGMNCRGVEPNEGYANYCKEKLDLDVANQTLEETKFAESSFDLIRLSHVLEHMRDPVRSLKVLHSWLNAGGMLYIEVPDIEAEAAQKMHGRLFHFGHIFNFNPVTLRLAAGLAGFEELPKTASRMRGSTAAFFCKAKGAPAFTANLAANAATMKLAMDAHNARQLPQPKIGSAFGRFVGTLSMRLKEIVRARQFARHREIADRSASHLQHMLSQP
ncbi:MAG: class I SAM-dependent methyltransferase [Rhizobiaceae bacterium]